MSKDLKKEAEEFLIKELNMSSIQQKTLYKGYAEAMVKFANQVADKRAKEKIEEFGFWILKNQKDYDLTVSVQDTVNEFMEDGK